MRFHFDLAAGTPIAMALIAIRTAIDVAVHAAVVRIRLRLAVADGAGKYRVIRGIGVASGTDTSRIAMVGWEPGVVEGRSGPRAGGVAGLTGGREPGRRVIRICRGLIVGLMAREAVGRNRGVVIVDVATGTGDRRMFPGQGKCGVAVVERRRDPGRGVVAHFALLREPRLNVVRVGGSLEVVAMAGGARGAVQAVVAIDMALRTLQRNVRPRQGKPGGRVIEGGIRPGSSGVAGVAGLRESRLGVIGVRRALVVLQMAGGAGAAAQ